MGWTKKPEPWLFLVIMPTLLMLAVLGTVFGDDNNIAEALRAFRKNTPSLRFFLEGFSDYGNVLLYMTYAVILVVAVKKRDMASGQFVACFLVSLAVTLLVVHALKILVSRPRPFVDGERELFSASKKFHSFPSNHSVETLAATLPLALRRRTVLFAAVIGAYNALAGFARLYLGSHYPSDILGSLIIGCFVSIACLRATRRIISSRARLS